MKQLIQATETKRGFDIKIILAFGAIYLVWGSVFLAVRFAIASFPPFLLTALRCLGGGILLYGWIALKTHENEKLKWRHWRQATIGGFCLFVLSQGYVAWAVQFVPSGITAVVMALLPLWVVLLEWWRPGGERPNKAVLFGIGIGFVGMVWLVAPGIVDSGASVGTLATLFLPVAALAWAIGTLYNRYRTTEASATAMSALQLLISGAMLLVVSTLNGDWGKVANQPIKGEAILSLLYLIMFATVLAFSAYVWLLRVVSPAKVATYAYVNPVVALLLGSFLAGESLTYENFFPCLIIVVGVVIIITFQHQHRRGQTTTTPLSVFRPKPHTLTTRDRVITFVSTLSRKSGSRNKAPGGDLS